MVRHVKHVITHGMNKKMYNESPQPEVQLTTLQNNVIETFTVVILCMLTKLEGGIARGAY